MGLAYGTPIPVTVDGPQVAGAATIAESRTPGGSEYLWRVEAVSYSVSDGWGGYSSTGPRLELFLRYVTKWTPCGARIEGGRWVDLREGRKQWASRTPEEALVQFRARRLAQIHILERQLARARLELELASERGALLPSL